MILFQRKVWRSTELSKSLNDLANKCMNGSDAWTVADFEDVVVKKLRVCL